MAPDNVGIIPALPGAPNNEALNLPALAQERSVVEDLDTLNHTHKEVCRQSYQGVPRADIAKHTGFTEAWVGRIINSPKGKIFIGELEHKAELDAMDLSDELYLGSCESVGYLRKVVRGDEPVPHVIKFKAAQQLLGSGGYGVIQKVSGEVKTSNEAATALALIKQNRERTMRTIEARATVVESNDKATTPLATQKAEKKESPNENGNAG
jgi:hypothetical protein